MTEEILAKYQLQLGGLTIQPSTGGKFIVQVNGQVVFSKHEVNRFPEVGEVADLIAQKVE